MSNFDVFFNIAGSFLFLYGILTLSMRGVFSGYPPTLKVFCSWRFTITFVFSLIFVMMNISTYYLHHKNLSKQNVVYEFQHWALESLHYTSPESMLFLSMSLVLSLLAVALPKKQVPLNQS